MKLEGKPTTVNVTPTQLEFLRDRSRQFNFSAFVREKLDDYMKLVSVIEEQEVEDG